MIIFNLWAVPVGMVIGLIYLGLDHFFPGIVAEPYAYYTAGAIAIVIGGIADLLGLKARVFFLPVWLIGIGIICAKIGPIGWVLLGLIAVACIIFIFRWSTKISAEEWRRAQEEFTKSPNPPTDTDLGFWNWIKTTLYFPLGSLSSEQCAHNLKVLECLAKARPQLIPPEAAGFIALEKHLIKNRNEAKCPGIDRKVQEAISKVLNERTKKTKPGDPFQGMAKPQDTIPAH